jgi:hypothetical protein
LKVVNHECETLDNDLAFVHFLQQGTGLYLLQALNILAEQVCCSSFHNRNSVHGTLYGILVQYGVAYGMVYGMVWLGIVLYMIWCGVVWYGMVWCGVVWCGV